MAKTQNLAEKQREKEIQEAKHRQRLLEEEAWQNRRKKLTTQLLAQQVQGVGNDGNYDGSWTCLTTTGKETGPCSILELCNLLLR